MSKQFQGVKVPILWPREQRTPNLNDLLANGCLRSANHTSMAQAQHSRNDASLAHDDPTEHGLPAVRLSGQHMAILDGSPNQIYDDLRLGHHHHRHLLVWLSFHGLHAHV